MHEDEVQARRSDESFGLVGAVGSALPRVRLHAKPLHTALSFFIANFELHKYRGEVLGRNLLFIGTSVKCMMLYAPCDDCRACPAEKR